MLKAIRTANLEDSEASLIESDEEECAMKGWFLIVHDL